jgi:EmrB/QacA subfamily drug resistance transporter
MTDVTADTAAPTTSTRSLRITFYVLAVSVGSYAMLQSLVVPVLPTIQKNLHTSQNTVTWVLTAYLLSASICTPILGRVGDMYGKKRIFVASLMALVVGSLLAAVATSVMVMIVARVIQGIAGAILPLTFGIIRDEFPRERVMGVIGSVAALIAVGAGLGIVLAGPIVDILGYHWLFWLPLIIVSVATVASYLFIEESTSRSEGSISWVAAILLSGWLVALLVAVSESSVWGWTSPKVIGLFVLAILIGIGWFFTEIRSANPLIDMRMMRTPAVWTVNLVALLFGIGMYATFAFLPEFLQTPSSAGYGFGASITESGLMLLPMTVTMFFVGLVSGRLSTRFGSKPVLFFASLVSIAPFVILAEAHTEKWEIVLATAILGTGFGAAFSAMSNLIVAAVPAHQTGVASGMNANIRTIGGSMGAAVMASIVTAGIATGKLPTDAGYVHGFIMLGGATAFATLAVLLIPSLKKGRPTPQELHDEMAHAEMALVAGGTLVGDESE